jgi:transposase
MILHPIDIERLVPEDHEVRAIWELVGSLDLSCYYDQLDCVEGNAGAPAFDPRLLVSLWVYAYSKGVGSAREIARLSEYDPAYQWLTGFRPVNYHTLADFRCANGQSLRQLFIEVLAMLTSEGLVTMERVMNDGTRIKASAGRDTLRGEGAIREHLARAEGQVKAMEEASEEEMAPRKTKARERAARERKERLSHALNELEKTKKNARVSATDPECRVMGQPDGGYAPSYNVQISTDAKEKAIVGLSISQSPADQTLLPSALSEIEATAGKLPNQIVVDAGFTTREAILAADERHVDLIGSFPDAKAGRETSLRSRGIDEAFWPEKFRFDPERNAYICPEGKLAAFRGRSIKRGKAIFHYRGKDCKGCPRKPSCCPGTPKGRYISRLENDPPINAFIKKMETHEARAVYKQRGEVAEFPNAWIKAKFGLRQFRLRGLVKAGTEALWACLTYNIKLWIRLCWKPRIQATG